MAIKTFLNFIAFACKYCTVKALKTLLVGCALLPVVWLIRLVNKNRSASLNYWSAFLILPAAFFGMNKIFYKPYTFWLTGGVYMLSNSRFGFVYSGVCFGLFLCFLCRCRFLKRRVKRLSAYGDKALISCARDLAAGENIWAKRYLSRVKVYSTDRQISPFSGGIWHPYIVVPASMFEQSDETERLTMLCHEYVHIRSGHIVGLTVFRLLWIYWWLNPYMYYMNRHLTEDMEMACDESCVRYAKTEPYAYGSVLLHVARNLKPKALSGMAGFVAVNDYGRIRERIFYLDKTYEKKDFFRGQKIQAGVFLAVIAGILALNVASSYPRYTIYEDLSLYDESINPCVEDDEELRRALTVQDGRVIVNKEEFADLLERYDIHSEYVYLPYDTVMKVPGYGGGGNTAMISTTDFDDIFYCGADTLDNRIMIFILKYIL